MFDIGFWELLVIAVVLLLVMGPERLPEVAKQAAFLVRKARQGMFRLRNEMRHEIDGTPFADLQKAKQEVADLKNDLRQFGRELADAHEPNKPKTTDTTQVTDASTTEMLPLEKEEAVKPNAGKESNSDQSTS